MMLSPDDVDVRAKGASVMYREALEEHIDRCLAEARGRWPVEIPVLRMPIEPEDVDHVLSKYRYCGWKVTRCHAGVVYATIDHPQRRL
jgi:hypothetical protein